MIIPIRDVYGDQSVITINVINEGPYIPVYISERTLRNNKCKWDTLLKLPIPEMLSLIDDNDAEGVVIEPYDEPLVLGKKTIESMTNKN